jgi:hypothetical protein
MRQVHDCQAISWRPSLSEMPRSFRIIPVTGSDAVNWISIALRTLSEPMKEDFAKGVDIGMNAITSELFLPLNEELPIERILSCFSSATVNRRAAKLSRILHLVHHYPGRPNLHMGLRFVTAALWASYAALKLEGEEGLLLSKKIDWDAKTVWTVLGWKVALA